MIKLIIINDDHDSDDVDGIFGNVDKCDEGDDDKDKEEAKVNDDDDDEVER